MLPSTPFSNDFCMQPVQLMNVKIARFIFKKKPREWKNHRAGKIEEYFDVSQFDIFGKNKKKLLGVIKIKLNIKT